MAVTRRDRGGDNGGKRGEGFIGTTIKDTWTIIMGGVETGQGGGEG